MAIHSWLYSVYSHLGKVESFILLLILLSILYKIYRIPFTRSHVESRIPSPPRWPILHHLPALLMKKGDVQELIEEWLPKYSKNGMMRLNILFGREAILITSPEDVKKILVSESHKAFRTNLGASLYPVIGRGVVFTRHKEHAWQRKLLAPAFTLNSTIAYIDIFQKHAEELVQVWKDKLHSSKDRPCQIVAGIDLERLTFHITGAAIFGYRFKSLQNGTDDFAKACEIVMRKGFGLTNMAKVRLFGFLKPFIRIGFVEEIDKAFARMIEGLLKIIDTQRKMLDDDSCGKVLNSKPNLLTRMIKLQDEDTGETFSDTDLLANVMVLALAGYDTSSTSLTWTLYLLSTHPDEQEKARKEVILSIGDKTEVKFEDLEKMPYVTAIIKESLRLHPPVPVTTREVCESITLGGTKIPVGYDVYVPLYKLQQSETYWSEPKRFKPERFLMSGNTAQGMDIGQKLLTFSMGSSGCIGSRFAMLEMQTVIAILLKYFRFSFPSNHPKISKSSSLTVKPRPLPRLEVALV